MLDPINQLDGEHADQYEFFIKSFPLPELDGNDPENPVDRVAFLRQGDHISLIGGGYTIRTDQPERSIAERRSFSFLQTDIPIAGIGWFVHTLEQRFFKSPEEGGIPFGSISYREVVSGEKLHVARSVNPPGYDLTNLDRTVQQYRSSSKQSQVFTDGMLFNEGGLDFLRELAKQLGEWAPPGESG